MKIFYDGDIFTRQRHGGISRIYSHIQEELPKVAPTDEFYFFRFPSSLRSHWFLSRSFYFIPKLGGLLRRLDGDVFLSRAAKSFNPDVFHASYYRLPADLDASTVVVVHDMIHERYPDMFNNAEKLTHMKRRAVERCDAVICPSESTKTDLINHFNVKRSKISVIHWAADPSFRPVDDRKTAYVRDRYSLDSQFLLYVGNRGLYKNFMTLLRAYASWELQSEFDLVCVGGGKGLSDEEAKIINDAEIDDSVRLVGGVDDEILRALYSDATMFVYPSQYEGFGIPPLEAMQCGTPVIASNVSSIPEVVGNAGVYFDPVDEDDLKKALTRVATDKALQGKLIEAGFEQAEQFDWKRTTREVYKVYQEIV